MPTRTDIRDFIFLRIRIRSVYSFEKAEHSFIPDIKMITGKVSMNETGRSDSPIFLDFIGIIRIN